MTQIVAGIDIHKKVLMVVVAVVSRTVRDGEVEEQIEYERRRLGSGAREREHLVAWMRERGVEQVVMESTAQYWRPVWLDLEPHFRKLHLAQAYSNKAPKGRKNDFGDAQRLTRRLVAGELILSFVPEAEQRAWRTMTRSKLQLVRDRVRLHNQLEALLEEMRIKLSSVISDLLGLSGRRILDALAGGEIDPVKLAELGDDRLKCSQRQLVDALRGRPEPMHAQILKLDLERLKLLDRQIESLDQMVAQALKKHEEAVIRLAETPGLGVDSAQQIIAEVGAEAKAFPSAAQFASWVGTIPGSDESAEVNHNSRSPKGEPLSQTRPEPGGAGRGQEEGLPLPECVSEADPRLGYKGAIWAIAHRLCRLVWKILHDGISYIEQGSETTPQAKTRRARKLAKALRKPGHNVAITPIAPAPAPAG